MRQSRHRHPLSLPPSIVATVRRRRRAQVALASAAAISLLAGGLVLASAPAGATPSSGYAVTELAIGSGSGVVAADTDTNTIYAGISGGLAVINGSTNAVTAQITGLVGPLAIAVDSATDTIYTFGDGGGDVINGATDTVTARFALPCTVPSAAAVNPMTDVIYVTGCPAPGQVQYGGVVVIDGVTNTVTATISVSLATQLTSGVAVDTSTNMIYVGDTGDSQLAVIDAASNTVSSRIAVPSGFYIGVAFDPANGLIYTASERLNSSVLVVDPATGSLSTLVTGLAAAPKGLAIDAGTGTLYAVSPGTPLGTAYVIDTATGAVDDQFPRGGPFVTVAVSGGPAYIGGLVNSSDITVATPSTANTMSPVIVGSTSFDFTVGQADQAQLTASATPVASFSATGLPAWLTLSPTGLLSGMPPAGTEGSTFSPVVTASNGVAPSDSAVISVTVDEPPAITSASQVTFAQGVAGSFTVTATGIPAPVPGETGALPAGVTFTLGPVLGTGLLSGTPAAGTAGVYPIQITAGNRAGTATQAFTLTVTAPPAVALGVEGTDSQLWAQSPLGSGWQPLGGVITAPPAVIAPPNPAGATPVQPWFLATGTDQRLWIRSLTANWQPTGPADCLGSPAVAVTGTGASAMVTVACRGLDNALWYTTTPLSALPTFTGTWTRVPSGVLSAAPAVAPVGTTMTFIIRGLDGAIWTWSATAGWSRTGWQCNAAPAAAQQAATGVTTFACQGSDGMLWTATNNGAAWSVPVSLGGPIAGSPGIAATTAETDILVEGLDQAVWERTPAGWSRIYASITGGAGATALN